jgi:uncharacterized protein with GYD domain
MPTYIQYYTWTKAGAETVKDQPTKRTPYGKELYKSMGVEVKALYYTFGKQDMITINEAPNDEVMATATLKLISLGPVTVETVKAFTEEEGRKIFEGIP